MRRAIPIVPSLVLLAVLASEARTQQNDQGQYPNPGNPAAPDYPTRGQGSIRLTALFNDPTGPEQGRARETFRAGVLESRP
jgi:hypothetical protein